MAHVTAGSLGKIKGGASRSKVGARPPGAPPKAVTRPDPDVGLTDAEVAERRATFGANALVEERRGLAKRLLVFFWGPIPWMIEVAAILSAVVRHWEDLAIIGTMLILNAVVGFWQEYKADTTIEALKQRLALRARVLRAGRWTEVEASELVPGDVVMVRLGKIVPADIALEGDGFLSVDQSALTGESLPVTRKGGDTIYSGSVVRMGEMRGFVVAIGMETYFGRTARLVETAETRSHFQKAVIKIGNFLIFVTLALVAVIVTVALFRHEHLVDTLMFALILTVAAIPVALPAVLSVTMAAGASKLARMKAIVSRLVSIEELAGMDILCSDKTGTLTKNELTLGDPIVVGARDAEELLLVAALASRNDGDAIDAAVRSRVALARLEEFQVARFEPFDPVRKRTEAEVTSGGATWTITKGAPQVILGLAQLDDEARRSATDKVDELAQGGYRTLGVARKVAGGPWQLLGLLSLFDPPRDDAAETIATCRRLGLQVRMVTGDNVAIAREIGRKLGLAGDIVAAGTLFASDAPADAKAQVDRVGGFAEVFPQHKFAIVEELKARGHIVGMTGDGVNDAPALKEADAGIAVSGATDAARAAADLVLTAPGLTVIARAVEEARRIFERMTSYAEYRIAETVRLLLFMTLSILIFGFYPVTPVMIVLLAILNDFPIMMIAYDNARVSSRPVRWAMPRVLTLSGVLGVLGVIASFTVFWIGRDVLHIPPETLRTVIFLKLLVAGHLTIYLTRNAGAIWDRPWPSWRLVVFTETTQALGTLAAVYGWFVAPIGWRYALMVWGYALAWFLINSGVKIATYRLLDRGLGSHRRHLQRVTRPLHPGAAAQR